MTLTKGELTAYQQEIEQQKLGLTDILAKQNYSKLDATIAAAVSTVTADNNNNNNNNNSEFEVKLDESSERKYEDLQSQMTIIQTELASKKGEMNKLKNEKLDCERQLDSTRNELYNETIKNETNIANIKNEYKECEHKLKRKKIELKNIDQQLSSSLQQSINSTMNNLNTTNNNNKPSNAAAAAASVNALTEDKALESQAIQMEIDRNREELILLNDKIDDKESIYCQI